MTMLGLIFDKSYEHVKVNNCLSRELSNNLKNQWLLDGGLKGGKFNPTLEIVRYSFYTRQDCQSVSKDDVRRLYVEVIEYLLYAYNSNIKLRSKLSNFPYLHKNVQIVIYIVPNENQLGEIGSVKGFRDKVIFTYETADNSYVRDTETFEEAYYKVYGREWDPFKYGECTISNQLESSSAGDSGSR